MPSRSPAMRLFATACLFAVVQCAVGCQAIVNRGWIAPPGPMNYQQANAVIHDPFPQADIGPDDHSIRPPDYQNPLPLPERNQTVTQLVPWIVNR